MTVTRGRVCIYLYMCSTASAGSRQRSATVKSSSRISLLQRRSNSHRRVSPDIYLFQQNRTLLLRHSPFPNSNSSSWTLSFPNPRTRDALAHHRATHLPQAPQSRAREKEGESAHAAREREGEGQGHACTYSYRLRRLRACQRQRRARCATDAFNAHAYTRTETPRRAHTAAAAVIGAELLAYTYTRSAGRRGKRADSAE